MKDIPKILLVDDEPDFLVVMEKLLEKHGYGVAEAVAGTQALEKAEKEGPDAIILDVMIPEGDGWEVCRKLKRNPATKDIPILMLTVMAEDESRERSFKYAGADWHINKPFDTDLFFTILDMASKREGKEEIERRINEMVERDKRLKKVYGMINPKILDHKYDFLED